MLKKMYSTDNTKSIEVAELNIDDKIIDLRKLIPKEFRGKLIIGLEVINDLQKSLVNIKKNNVESRKRNKFICYL